LSDCSYKVRGNKYYSEIVQLYAGVPQGSALSFLLFMLLLSELLFSCYAAGRAEFADDLVILDTAKNLDQSANKINK